MAGFMQQQSQQTSLHAPRRESITKSSGHEKPAILRTNSLVDITMKEYLDSIHEEELGDDDGGVFF